MFMRARAFRAVVLIASLAADAQQGGSTVPMEIGICMV
jgi:hypothetical protein